MNPSMTSWARVAVLAGGYLLGIYFQNRSIAHLDKRIDDLRSDMMNRCNDLRALIESEIRRVESRLERVESRLERVEIRLEHPLVRP
jgi:hypothetical protein